LGFGGAFRIVSDTLVSTRNQNEQIPGAGMIAVPYTIDYFGINYIYNRLL